MRAIEPPAGLVALMREYRMNADLRLRLIVEDFNFAALHARRVEERYGLQWIVGLGIVNPKFEPHKIACVHKTGQREQNCTDPLQERFRPHEGLFRKIGSEKILQRRARGQMAA
jgi:hypothetical protein